jgi:hypothetical protein
MQNSGFTWNSFVFPAFITDTHFFSSPASSGHVKNADVRSIFLFYQYIFFDATLPEVGFPVLGFEYCQSLIIYCPG